MTKFPLTVLLLVLFFYNSNTSASSDTLFLSISSYLDLALEENVDLKKTELLYLRDQALLDLKEEVLKPQFSIDSIPLYSVDNARLLVENETEDYFTHNFNIGFSLSSIVLTGATVSLSLSNSVTYGSMDEIFFNNPVLSFGFSQPLFVNDGIFNIRGYKAEVLSPGLNREMVHLEMSKRTNQQVLELIREYYAVLVNERKIRSIKQKVNVYIRQLDLFKIQRDQGSLSVTDYWEKELEVKDLEKQVFDREFLLTVEKRKLSSLIGLSTDKVDISLENTIPVIELPEEILFEETLVYRIGNMQSQLNYLAIQTEMKNYAPTLGINLSVKPQYPVYQSGSGEFTESMTNLWASDSWIEFSGSIIFSFPVSLMKQGQLKHIALTKEAEIEKLELEEARNTLSDKKNELFDKIIYLKAQEQYLSDQIEYYIKRKFEKEKLFQIDSSSSLEIKIAGLDIDSARTELFSNNVEIFLSILDLYILKGSNIYTLLHRSLDL